MSTAIPNSYRKILYVVNPWSGSHKDDVLEIIQNFHEGKSDVEVNYLFPDKKNFIDLIEQKCSENSYDTIVACGGDGTVRTIAEYVYGKNIRMGILPIGSANGLAKNLSIPLDLRNALEIIYRNEKYTSISSLTINGQFSIHLADAGLNARLVRHFEHSGKRGFIGYVLAGLKVLRDYDFFKISIQTGQITHHFKACMVVIANATMYGTGFVINNTGDITDDEFEIVIIKRLSLKGFLKMAMNNWIPDPALIHVIKTKEVEIISLDPLSIQIDGEYIGKSKTITASIHPNFIEVITP